MAELNESDIIRLTSHVIESVFHKTPEIRTEHTLDLGHGVKRRADLYVEIDRQVRLIFEIKRWHSLPSALYGLDQLIFFKDNLNLGSTKYLLILYGIPKPDDHKNLLNAANEREFPLSNIVILDERSTQDQLLASLSTALRTALVIEHEVSDRKLVNKHQIFISYRRADSAWAAGRLADFLSQCFGKHNIFFDTASIRLGDDFEQVINDTIDASNILIAIIGPNWIGDGDRKSVKRRIDNSDDFVRIEVKMALEKKLLVIPILVDGAKMPSKEDLPDDLKELAFKYAGQIEADSFHDDVRALVNRLKENGLESVC